MEKYSESVKDAQEKLEQAEKKATDVSVIREGSKEPQARLGREKGTRSLQPQNRQVPSLQHHRGQVYTSSPRH